MKTLLTETREDYIRAIYYLEDKSGGTAKSVDVAKLLKLSRSTVAERLNELSAAGFLRHERYGGVSLTTRGKKVAKRLTFRHRIIEVFLHSVLNRPIGTVHNEAHKLEHAFSDASVKKLYTLMNKPKTDPHGKPIIYSQ